MSVFLITLGFVPNRLFKHTAQRLCDSLSGKHDIRKIFVAKPYPINTELNFELNHRTCRKYGYEYLKLEKDSGAAQDFNRVYNSLGIVDNDIVILYDHDIYPVEDNWDDACLTLLSKDKTIDWVCLWNPASDTEFGERGGISANVEGIEYFKAITPMCAMTSVIRGSFLNHTKGLIQPCAYYGGVELAMWPKLRERNTYQAFLPQFREDQRLKEHEDMEYREWKRAHTFGGYVKSFAEYLNDPSRCALPKS